MINNSSIRVSLNESDCHENCTLSYTPPIKEMHGIVLSKNTNYHYLELSLYNYKKPTIIHTKKKITSLKDETILTTPDNLYSFIYNNTTYYIKKIFFKRSLLTFFFKNEDVEYTYEYELKYICESKTNNESKKFLHISVPLDSSENKDINKLLESRKNIKKTKRDKTHLDSDFDNIKKYNTNKKGKINSKNPLDNNPDNINYDTTSDNDVFILCNTMYDAIKNINTENTQNKHIMPTLKTWSPFIFLPENNRSSYKTSRDFITYSNVEANTIYINYIYPIFIPVKFYNTLNTLLSNENLQNNEIVDFKYHQSINEYKNKNKNKNIKEDFTNKSGIIKKYNNIKYYIYSNRNKTIDILLLFIILYYVYKIICYIMKII